MGEEAPTGNVGSIRAPEELPVNPAMKKLSKQEKDFYEAQTEGYKQDTAERKKYAFRIFLLCCIWVSAVLLLLIAQGLSRFTQFHLSETVLLAAIGSTTANIIAVFVIVARYLFPDKSSH